MTNFLKINREFIKIALSWDDLTLRQQKDYLNKHPLSKKKLTGRPRSKTKEQQSIKLLSSIIKESPFANHAFLAGGFVRDELLGKKSKDIDITVTALNGGIKLAEYISKKLGIREPVIFPTFGTAKIQLKNSVEVEFVQTRNEEYAKHSRKPKTSFGTIQEDVERRDFTINSLLYDLTNNKTLDLTGKGLKDLNDGIIRTPLNPNITFNDDPLRMMRAVRFAVKYNFKFADDIEPAIKTNAQELNFISAERIQDEFNKILLTNNPSRGLEILKNTGLLKQFMPELLKLEGIEQGKFHYADAWTHTMDVLKQSKPTLTDRLSAVFHDIGKADTRTVTESGTHFYAHDDVSKNITQDVMKRMKYPNDMINIVSKVVESHMRTRDSKTWSKASVRRFIRDMGPELEHVLNLIEADRMSHVADHTNMDEFIELKNRIKQLQEEKPIEQIKLPISGNEVMQILNIPQGPEVGKILNYLKDQLMQNPDMTKDEAIDLIKNN